MIDIVIVNWNTGAQGAGAHASVVQHHEDLVASVVVVDNASTDDSLTQAAALKGLTFPLRVANNSVNRGFAVACNQGAALGSSEFLLFLNPDTKVFAGSLKSAWRFLNARGREDVGITGIQLIDECGMVARSCGRFPTLRMLAAHIFAINRFKPFRHINMHMSEWAHDMTREVDHVIGAFFFVRRSLFSELGGFDERFFVYLEDLDFSFRLRQRGYKSFYLSEAQAFHAGGGASRQVKAHRLFYSLRSRLLYGLKHFRRPQAWVLLCLMVAVEPLTRCLFAAFRLDGSAMINTISAYGMLFRDMPKILRTGLRS
jgi:GT2 family glycosyltransferase